MSVMDRLIVSMVVELMILLPPGPDRLTNGQICCAMRLAASTTMSSCIASV